MLLIIITLFIILVILAIISVNIYITDKNNQIFDENLDVGCIYKRWGCCNDKLTTKLDQYGTNCRGF